MRRGPVDDRPTQRLQLLVQDWIARGGLTVDLTLLLKILEREEARDEARAPNVDHEQQHEETFTMKKWLQLAQIFLPMVLAQTTVPPALIPTIVHATGEAEARFSGDKSGPEKLAHVLQATRDGLTVLNQAKGKDVVDVEGVVSAVESGIKTGVQVVNVVHKEAA